MTWQDVWRDAAAPLLSDTELIALHRGLASNDPAIIQGATTVPPPLYCMRDWPVEACCLLGYTGWKGHNLTTVAEVEEYFARMCFEIDQRLGVPAGCRFLLNPFDTAPREELWPLLLAEVEKELQRRGDV